MIYLSRLWLNPRARRTQQELANRYEMHRTLAQAFTEEDFPHARVLFRIEDDSMEGVQRLIVLVQSQRQPDWSTLGPSCAEGSMHGYLIRPAECKFFEPCITAGDTYRFRLTANPTKRLCNPDKSDGKLGKRMGLYLEEEQEDWFKRKALLAGFTPLEVSIQPHGKTFGRLYREEKRHALTLLEVQFDGVLRVEDPTLLMMTLQGGIGSGKGLGFGLLSLARAA